MDSKNLSSGKPSATTSDLSNTTQKSKKETSSTTKECKICNVDFGQPNDLKRHLKKVCPVAICDQN